MTAVDQRPGPTGHAEAPHKAPAGLAVWVRDLLMGMRFAVGSGREGWTRTLLTAVGVGLGVALLLGASSVPSLLGNRSERSNARNIEFQEQTPKPSDSSFLFHRVGSQFRGESVDGVLLRPDGSHPTLPPGVDKMPGPGEAVVSPSLKELLDSPDGKLLHDRLPYRVVGTIGQAGLIGPAEHYYYAGSDQLSLKDSGTNRASEYGWTIQSPGMDPVLMVLILIGCVVLLMPVAIFIATAVRFGGERRDRRLAALRLVGADNHMARRIAAGEALLGSLFGLVVGAGLFLFGRQFIGAVDISSLNAFPTDLSPVPALAVLILLAVPASAVVVTLLALRGIAIEPLGVVRSAVPRRRRLWWRLPIPVVGLALLAAFGTVDKKSGSVNTYAIAGGAALTLLGLTMLLPWLVEAVVARFKGGPVPGQLAARRLQLSSSSAARAVSGITVAVAGAIALQMLFFAVGEDFTKATGQDTSRAQMQVMLPARDGATTQKMIEAFEHTRGVSGVIATIGARVSSPGPERGEGGYPLNTSVTVGSCETLQELSRPGPCKDGDVFEIKGSGPDAFVDEDLPKIVRPGAQVLLNGVDDDGKMEGPARRWTLPRTIRPVQGRPDPSGEHATGLYATMGAVDIKKLDDPTARAMVRLDPSVPDAAEHARNTAARFDVTANVFQLMDTTDDRRFVSVRNGLLIASVATMTLIAASMLVTTLEQLRERRRLLSVLVAFGTRRGTLAWSVLWQTAVPMTLGLALAVAGGLGLGRVLLGLADKTGVAWSVVWPLPLFGAALILLVTLLSMPPLWRMMRADGLRTE
ncbi:ABC transporter permease [Streptomyces chrestomyceticus]|uniref:ABC transporter permease n=1 Tax=Streptomyces chrestomyceticus TaxID=68185 RepID=UPI0033CEE003